MNKESELNALVSILNDKREDLDTAGSNDDHHSDALQSYQVAANNLKIFKRDNMAQILKDRKAK